MKKAVFSILLLLFTIVSSTAFARSYEIYNNGKFTGITNVLELDSDREYIEIKDLPKLNMEYSYIDGGFRISGSYKSVDIYFDKTLDISVNNYKYTFENPIATVDDVHYLFLDVIGKCFSSGYSGSLKNGVWCIYLDVGGEPEGELPADGVQIDDILCDYVNDVFVIHFSNQYDHTYQNVRLLAGYYDKNGRLIDATMRNEYTIEGNNGDIAILPIESCMDTADSVKLMLWTGDGIPTAENIIIKDFKFDREMSVPDEKEQLFGDITTDYQYYNSIYIMNKQDLGTFYGYDDGNYYPDNYVTRSEFAHILSSLLGMNFQAANVDCSFYDVTRKHWCYDMASFAVAKNYMTTTRNGEFLPDDYITFNAVLYAFLRVLGEDVVAGEKHIQKALERNLFKGPLDLRYYITRGELTHLAYNFMMEYTKTE